MKPFFTTKPVIFYRNTGSPDRECPTLSAIQDAVENGADVIALDIVPGEHERPVISPANMTGTDADPLLLADVLSAFPEQRFCVYLNEKNRRLAGSLCDVIRETGSEQRILVSSNHGDNLKLVRFRCPEAATSFTLLGTVGFYWLFRSGLLNFRKRFSADVLLMPEGAGVSYLANQGLIAMAHERGIHVYVYIMNSSKQIKRVIKSGADGFITDDPGFLKRELDKNRNAGEERHE